MPKCLKVCERNIFLERIFSGNSSKNEKFIAAIMKQTKKKIAGTQPFCMSYDFFSVLNKRKFCEGHAYTCKC